MTAKIKTKIIAGFSSILLLTLIISISSYFQISSINKTMTDLVEREMKLQNISNEVRYNFSMQSANIRGYIITRDESFIEKYKQAATKNSELETQLIELSYTEKGKQLAEEIKKLDDEYSAIVEQTMLPLFKAGKNEEGIAVMKNEVMSTATKTFNKAKELIDFRTQRMKITSDAASAKASKARSLIIIISAVACALGIVLATIITRLIANPIKVISEGAKSIASGDLTKTIEIKSKDEIGDLAEIFNHMTKELRDLISKIMDTSNELGASSEELLSSAEQTVSANEQISSTITELASGASNQAKSVEGASEIVSQLSSGTQQVASSIEGVSYSSTKAADVANIGLSQAQDAVNKIEKVQKVSAETAEVVMELGKKSKEIGRIIEVIKNIADQTNLLALNAAIEAARAGEQGKGFAVVADEVRKLAEQSAESTKQISLLIESIQKETETAISVIERGNIEVNQGVEAVNVAGTSFKTIAKEISHVVEETQQVSAAAQQMASGSQQIVSLIDNIAVVAEEAAASSQEVSSASEEQTATMESVSKAAEDLANLGQELQNLVVKFKV